MPRTLFLATPLAVGMLAACAGGPLKTSVPAGLTYECDVGGPAMIRFGDGGYLPDSTGRGADGASVPRSTAELEHAGARHRMVAEWTEQGLRYRSAEPDGAGHYLIWSQRAEDANAPETWTRRDGPRGAEDVRLGRRATAQPESDEGADGEEVALCRRSGRTPHTSDGAPAHDPPPAPAHEAPHRR